jgi:hypothetical protein
MKKTYHLPLTNVRVLLLHEGGESFGEIPLLLEGGVARSGGVVGLFLSSLVIFHSPFSSANRCIPPPPARCKGRKVPL